MALVEAAQYKIVRGGVRARSTSISTPYSVPTKYISYILHSFAEDVDLFGFFDSLTLHVSTNRRSAYLALVPRLQQWICPAQIANFQSVAPFFVLSRAPANVPIGIALRQGLIKERNTKAGIQSWSGVRRKAQVT